MPEHAVFTLLIG
uniref:Uncharacterized protein n=1 Tax=Anguilla anguilla TaxID=7936 RepID=A0A0E9PU63_ANGAN